MDPFTIATGVAKTLTTLYQVTDGIVAFRRAVKEIDESVEDLGLQVKGLGQVLSALSEAIQYTASKSRSPSLNDDLLQKTLPSTVNACLETLTRLKELLGKLQALKPRNTVRQTWRTIKKQWYQTELDGLLGRIKTHSLNLQLAVNTLILYK